MNEDKMKKAAASLAEMIGHDNMVQIGEALMVKKFSESGATESETASAVMLTRAVRQLSEGFANMMAMAEISRRLDVAELASGVSDAIKYLGSEMVSIMTEKMGASAEVGKTLAARAREVDAKHAALVATLKSEDADRASEAQRIAREAVERAMNGGGQ